MYNVRDINFGEIDHFLYVRINCVCADLGLGLKDFIEQAYYLLVDLIDPKGVTHYEMLQEEYEKYAAFRERARYAPRKSKEKHAIVIRGIHEEVHEHLACIKDEMKWPWINILKVLLMSLEAEIDRMDAEAWEDGQVKGFVAKQFKATAKKDDLLPRLGALDYEEGSYQIDKTKKRRMYEKAKGLYPEGEGFRMRKV
jgi:hypothetical protein